MKQGTWIEPGTGQPLTWRSVIANAAQSSAVMLGESHDRADNHRWQTQIIAALLACREDLVVGFEMFPARLNDVLAAVGEHRVADVRVREGRLDELFRDVTRGVAA